ncbi:MAG: histone deacetylase [Kofleriaceae bacterium]|nr:histone deacetylase [Kofleriaceae bacterium]
MLGYVLDEVFLDHHAPSGHPERPARATAARDALLATGITKVGLHVAVRAPYDSELAAVHDGKHLEQLAKLVAGNDGWVDPDTYFSKGSWRAATSAVGATCELALQSMAGQITRGVAVVRPPGHHATRDRAMGFCLLNNVAAAAAAARAAGAARVAIVDWDVHHGNGTQDIFWDDPNVMYLSVHQFPYYPGTGAPTEVGGPAALGQTLNVGLPAGAGDADYLAVAAHVFAPALREFKPDLILISAGFDAFVHDPIAGMTVTAGGFAALSAVMRLVADDICGGRIIAVLEGGYDLEGVGSGMAAVANVFMQPSAYGALAASAPSLAVGGNVVPLPISGGVRAALDATATAHRPWAAWARQWPPHVPSLTVAAGALR